MKTAHVSPIRFHLARLCDKFMLKRLSAFLCFVFCVIHKILPRALTNSRKCMWHPFLTQKGMLPLLGAACFMQVQNNFVEFVRGCKWEMQLPSTCGP